MGTGSVSARRRCREKGEYYRQHERERYKIPEVRAKKIESGKILRAKRGTNQSCCNILRKHHESMKYDDNHLTTEFIKSEIKKLTNKNVDCKDLGDD